VKVQSTENKHIGKGDTANSKSPKPNIIFILADDLGYGDLGCYGQSKIATPNLDKMANEGIQFTNHYAGSTVCGPSRASLMLGMDTGHSYIRGNDPLPITYPLRPQDYTVADLLKNGGYRTAVIGKWGLGNSGTTGTPNKQGFDYFYGYLSHVRAHNAYTNYLWRNNEKVQLSNKVVMASEGYAKDLGSVSSNKLEYANDLFTEEAISYINKSTPAEPFFLYLAYTIPHANNEHNLLYEHGMEVPSLGLYQNENWPEVEKSKAAAITRMDTYIGQILDLLKNKGIDKNTLVIFTSDNGPHAEGNVNPEFFDSNYNLRGIKRDLYEGGVKVPFIAWWPETIQAGKKTNHQSAFWDFMATCSDITNVPLNSNSNGISYLPTLLGQEQNQKQHDYLYWEFNKKGKKQALIYKNWKLIHLLSENLYELYDLDQDVEERNNVLQFQPELTELLKDKMAKARTPSKEFPLNK
tara:strand:+ start:985 stop:2382 length:1398 start_codon:yes stop_codon:yes gene_type:complete